MYINEREIVGLIKNKDVISFDVFDTLLCRNVSIPEDIFKIVEKFYELKYGYQIYFEKRRVDAAKNAYGKKKNSEVTFEEIYEELSEYDGKTLCNLKSLELYVEKLYLQRNEEIFHIYNICKKMNKRIVAVSDMYLPSCFLENILKENGYNFEKVFVSCEWRANKREGELFEIVAKKLDIPANKILHFGDCIKSDYIMPKFKGMSSVLVEKNKCKIKNSSLQYKIINSIIYNNLKNNNDYFYVLGYSILGPILLGFCQWLNKESLKKNIDQLLFLSRDGYILKKAYKFLYGEKLNSSYFYISRRAINVAALVINSNFDELNNRIAVSPIMTVRKFIYQLGLKPEKYVSLLYEYGLHLDHEYYSTEFFSKKNIRDFYDKIKKDVLNNSENQYILFNEYFNSFVKGTRIGLVDIGWRGSMQKKLQEILLNEKNYNKISLEGFYLGVESNDEQMHGYLYESNNQNKNKTVIDSSVGLFESLFLAREGTTLSYKKNMTIKPILAEYENNEQLSNKLKKIHNGALEFIKKCKELHLQDMEVLENGEALKRYKEIALFPTPEDIVSLANIQFDDANRQFLIERTSLIDFIKSPGLMKNNYKKAPWKIGFLKLNVSQGFPWGRIYEILKNKGQVK